MCVCVELVKQQMMKRFAQEKLAFYLVLCLDEHLMMSDCKQSIVFGRCCGFINHDLIQVDGMSSVSMEMESACLSCLCRTG